MAPRLGEIFSAYPIPGGYVADVEIDFGQGMVRCSYGVIPGDEAPIGKQILGAINAETVTMVDPPANQTSPQEQTEDFDVIK